ncbi:hypothetical protein VaNZ11_002214, partial [Volvox africanus]
MLPPTAAAERDAIAAFLAMKQQTINLKEPRVPAAPNSSQHEELSRQLNSSPPAANPDPNSEPNPHLHPSQQVLIQPTCQQPILPQQQQPPCSSQQSLHAQRMRIMVSTKDSDSAAEVEVIPNSTVQGLVDRQPLIALTQALQPSQAQAQRLESPCPQYAALSRASINPHCLGPLTAGLFRSRGIQAPAGSVPGHLLSGAARGGSGDRQMKSPRRSETAVTAAALPTAPGLAAEQPPPPSLTSASTLPAGPPNLIPLTPPRAGLQFAPLQANLMNNRRARPPLESSAIQFTPAAAAAASAAAASAAAAAAAAVPSSAATTARPTPCCHPFGPPGPRPNQQAIAFGGLVSDDNHKAAAAKVNCGLGSMPLQAPLSSMGSCTSGGSSNSRVGGGADNGLAVPMAIAPMSMNANCPPPLRRTSAEPLPLSRFAHCSNSNCSVGGGGGGAGTGAGAGAGGASMHQDAVLNAPMAVIAASMVGPGEAATAAARPPACDPTAANSATTSVTFFPSWSSEGSFAQQQHQHLAQQQQQQQEVPSPLSQEQQGPGLQRMQTFDANVIQQQQQGLGQPRPLPQQHPPITQQQRHQERSQYLNQQQSQQQEQVRHPPPPPPPPPSQQQQQSQQQSLPQPQQRFVNHDQPTAHEAPSALWPRYQRRHERLRQTCEYQAKQFLQQRQQLILQHQQEEEHDAVGQVGVEGQAPQQHQQSYQHQQQVREAGLESAGPVAQAQQTSFVTLHPSGALTAAAPPPPQRRQLLSAMKMPAWMRKVVQQRLAADTSDGAAATATAAAAAAGHDGGPPPGVGASGSESAAAGWLRSRSHRFKSDARHSMRVTFGTVVEGEEGEDEEEEGNLVPPEACPSPVLDHEAMVVQDRRSQAYVSSAPRWGHDPPPPPERQQDSTSCAPVCAARRLDWAKALGSDPEDKAMEAASGEPVLLVGKAADGSRAAAVEGAGKAERVAVAAVVAPEEVKGTANQEDEVGAATAAVATAAEVEVGAEGQVQELVAASELEAEVPADEKGVVETEVEGLTATEAEAEAALTTMILVIDSEAKAAENERALSETAKGIANVTAGGQMTVVAIAGGSESETARETDLLTLAEEGATTEVTEALAVMAEAEAEVEAKSDTAEGLAATEADARLPTPDASQPAAGPPYGNDDAVSPQEQLAPLPLTASVSPNGGNSSCFRPMRGDGETRSYNPGVPEPTAVPWWQTLCPQSKGSRSNGKAKSSRSSGGRGGGGGSCRGSVESSSVEARGGGGGSGSCSNSGGDTSRSSVDCVSQENDAGPTSDEGQCIAPPPPKLISQQVLLPVQQLPVASEHALLEQQQQQQLGQGQGQGRRHGQQLSEAPASGPGEQQQQQEEKDPKQGGTPVQQPQSQLRGATLEDEHFCGAAVSDDDDGGGGGGDDDEAEEEDMGGDIASAAEPPAPTSAAPAISDDGPVLPDKVQVDMSITEEREVTAVVSAAESAAKRDGRFDGFVKEAVAAAGMAALELDQLQRFVREAEAEKDAEEQSVE